MNVIKHMEAAFLVALSLTAAASVAVDSIQPAPAAPASAQTFAATAGVPVVHVTAKRLTAEQKQQMLALERVRSRA